MGNLISIQLPTQIGFVCDEDAGGGDGQPWDEGGQHHVGVEVGQRKDEEVAVGVREGPQRAGRHLIRQLNQRYSLLMICALEIE